LHQTQGGDMFQGQISSSKNVKAVSNQIAMCKAKGNRSQDMSRTVINGIKNVTDITNLSRLTQNHVNIYIEDLQEKVTNDDLTRKTTATYISYLNNVIKHTNKYIDRNHITLQTISAADYGLSKGTQMPCLPPTSNVDHEKYIKELNDKFKETNNLQYIAQLHSVTLQRVLGLRDEESKCIKITDLRYTKDGKLIVGYKDNTKNHRQREVTVTPEGKIALKNAVNFAKANKWYSLTPPGMKVKNQIKFAARFNEYFKQKTGINYLQHGNRRHFACEKLAAIKAANPNLSDKEARLILSAELGHNRVDVTYRYVPKE